MPRNVSDTKILFFGTSDFAIPVLDALLQSGYDIAAIVTNPDEPAGRDQIITPPPVKSFISKQTERNIKIFQPEKLDENIQSDISDIAPDLFVVAAYGKIIPKHILDIPKFGALNVHPSLLPRWRGPSPIQYAILHGDEETGVTIILVDEKMDHGQILTNYKLQITNYKFTTEELSEKLAELGAQLLVKTIPQWLHGEITPTPQDDMKATYSKMIKKDDARIDWKKSAEEIERIIRAFNPKPGAWTIWPRADALYRIRIGAGVMVQGEPPHGSPGYVWRSLDYPLLVKTGKESIAVGALTLEGRKSTDASSFIHGYSDVVGSNFI